MLDPELPRASRPAPYDQAATLRRMFAGTGGRLLPVLVAAALDDARVALMASLAAALARHHGTALAIDAARLRIGVALDVALRRDLADVLAGEAPVDAAVIAATPRLAVASAARAVEHHGRRPGASLERVLEAAGMATHRWDWVLMWVAARASACLRGAVRSSPAAEAIVPVSADPAGIDAALTAIRFGRTLADIRVFRLLFLGMDRAAAGTLFHRMAAMRPGGAGIELRYGDALNSHADAERLAAAVAGWELMRAGPDHRDGADLESLS